MTLPASIENLLKKHNVSYCLATLTPSTTAKKHETNVRSIQQSAHEQSARAHLLQNADREKLLAITPSQTIIDLEAVKTTLGTTYTPVVGEALQNFLANLGLKAMAAMPRLGNLPTIVDPLLLKSKRLLIDVGEDNQHIVIDGKSFEKLLESTTVNTISIPLSKLNQAVPSKLDTAQISKSVELFTELRIKQRLEETLELPALPITAQKIIKLRVNPNADVCDLCSIIELDPSLAAQVISWASSPYYSAPGTIKSIHDAIVRVLGFDMVLNLALGLALGNTLKLPEHRPDGYLPYWEQAVYVATCTEAIISCMPRECRPSYGCSYLSGLLHNFGYLITSEVFSNQFKTICQHVDASPHSSPLEIERHIIGVTRNQLASWLMRFWHMPEEVCVALRHQNETEFDKEFSEYSALLYITKKLLNEKGIRTCVSNEPIPESLFARFQLNPEEAREAIDIMLESSDLLESMAQQMQS